TSAQQTPASGESAGKEIVTYVEQTDVQSVNTVKVNTVLFADENGVVMGMVNEEDFEEGELWDHCLTKEQIAMMLDL
ncbi:hypothetical protein NL520_28690, partial [Klebsiella pneumoniae]|nr:hypothetical protein [Klebsiella pneumoniae]